MQLWPDYLALPSEITEVRKIPLLQREVFERATTFEKICILGSDSPETCSLLFLQTFHFLTVSIQKRESNMDGLWG